MAKVLEIDDDAAFKPAAAAAPKGRVLDISDEAAFKPAEKPLQPGEVREVGKGVIQLGPEAGPTQAEASLRGGFQGLTSNFGEEATAGLRALADGGDIRGIGDRYRKERDSERARNAAAQKEWPKTYGASELGGGIASAFIPVPGLGAAKGVALAADASRMAKAAAFLKGGGKLAALGATAGLGASEADLTKGDFEGAAKDAALGAGTSLAFGGAVTGLGKLASGAAGRIENRALSAAARGAVGEDAALISENRELAQEVLRGLSSKGLPRDNSAAGRALGSLRESLSQETAAGRAALDAQAPSLNASRVVDALEEVRSKLASNPAADARVAKLDKLIDSIKAKWVPDAPVAPAAAEQVNPLQRLADKAGGRVKERIAARSDDVLEVAKKYGVRATTPAEYRATATEATQKVGAAIGDKWQVIDKHSKGVSMGEVMKSLDGLRADFDSSPATKAQAEQVVSFMQQAWNSWGEQGSVAPSKVRSLITSVQNQGFGGSLADPTAAQALKRDIAGRLGEVLDTHLADLKKPAAKKAAAELKDLNKSYSILVDLKKASTKQDAAAKLAPPPKALPLSAVEPAIEKSGEIRPAAVRDMLANLKPEADAHGAVSSTLDGHLGASGFADRLGELQRADRRVQVVAALQRAAEARGPSPSLASTLGDALRSPANIVAGTATALGHPWMLALPAAIKGIPAAARGGDRALAGLALLVKRGGTKAEAAAYATQAGIAKAKADAFIQSAAPDPQGSATADEALLSAR